MLHPFIATGNAIRATWHQKLIEAIFWFFSAKVKKKIAYVCRF